MEDQNMDYLVVCAIIKDEALYIEEWIEFHRLVGIQRFYIYDNNSSDNIKLLLKPYIEEGMVIYQEWPKHPGQMDAYNHFLANYGNKSTWVTFIDADEFLFGVKEDNLQGILKQFENFSGLCVNWVCFGSSGHIKKPKGFVIENFTKRPALDFSANRHVKCIVQTKMVTASRSAHIFSYKNDELPVTEDGNKIKPIPENLDGALTEKCSFEIIRLNHYLIKSKEECDVKLKRTMVGRLINIRGNNYFPIFDQNTDKDEAILRFLPQLKERFAIKYPGSVIPMDFDWEQYVANYPDLQQAGISTKEMAEGHWMKHGYFEKRSYRKKVNQ